jgi:hypothetical protein
MLVLLYNILLSVLGGNIAALAWQGPPRTDAVRTIEAIGTFAPTPTPTPTSSESLSKRQFIGGPGFCAYVAISGLGAGDLCKITLLFIDLEG